jgi:hypothetical protein
VALKIDGKIFFLHVPKTGGNWVAKILKESGVDFSECDQKYATYDIVCGRLRTIKDFQNYQFFCFVRNPLVWYGSWYKYQLMRGFRKWGESGVQGQWHVMSGLNSCIGEEEQYMEVQGHPTFNEFMMRVNADSPGFAGYVFRSYTVNSSARVLRAESSRQAFLALCKEWELPVNRETIIESPNENVSSKVEITWDHKVFESTVRNETATFALYNCDWKDVVAVD